VKITRIESTPLAIPLAQEFHWAGGAQVGANLVLFTVHTDEGVAGYGESDATGFVPGKIDAAQVVTESLAAYDAGRRSLVPGRTVRWFIRSTKLGPRALQLRVAERMYRPKD